MANVSIRKLDDHVYNRIREQAIRHGVSMEEEIRQIISRAVSTPKSIRDVFRSHFGQKNGIDLTNAQSMRHPHDPMDF